MAGENSFAYEYTRQLGWAAIKPVSFWSLTAGALLGTRELAKSPWMIKQFEAAKAADEAYQAELLRAYKFTYPEDTDITQVELAEFGQTARGIVDTFRESNFDYQNHIYKKLMDLYGSPQGALEETYIATGMNLGEFVFGATILGGGIAAAVALVSTVTMPFKAWNRANGWW
jgi:hypothetical protein